MALCRSVSVDTIAFADQRGMAFASTKGLHDFLVLGTAKITIDNCGE
jgi:hypothetical protein